MDIRVKDIIKDNSIWLPSQDYDEKKKLSILMPTFGRWKDDFLKRAVTSYIEQTFKDTELIIIDDANTDGTSEQIDEFMRQDKRISCIRHKQNMGLPAISLYEAIRKARGEYIGFLFDNCVLYPSAYERSLRRMEEEGAQASYGRVLVHTDKDDMSKKTEFYYEEKGMLVYGSVGAALLNVVLNAVLIPAFGFVAAGYTTFISYIVFALSNFYTMRLVLKKKKLPDNMYNYKALLIIFILFMLSGFLGVILYAHLIARVMITLIVFMLLVLNRNKFIEALEKIKGR